MLHTTFKLSLSVLLLTFSSYSFAAFAQTEDPLLSSIRKTGKVTVAISSLPPYMIVSPSGEATGASIELQNMVLHAMNLPALTPVLTQWDAMMPGLQAGQFDYVGAGLAITEARCKVALFSAPYAAGQLGLHVLPGNPKRLTSVAEAARRPDIKLAAIVPTPYQAYALKQGVKPEQIVTVPDVQAGIATVVGGRADAFIANQFNIKNPAEKGIEIIVDESSPVEAYAFTFRKENMGFRDAYNKQLDVLIGSGTIQKLYAKYGLSNGEAVAKLLSRFSKASDVFPVCE
ncbi:polar amino acid transport system substrate-binding protein [Bradyrhizobium sp. IAR9]|uniref:transporter substrate-binding domain-containing protein n=1 Tax=Bradyrhizobium sp. IAR9 TaxID=2663841 RepID=UPI0015CB5F0C|nr:transporter substrate-binding domain-containing protein [Bradyrhizobium sp. IAR9]NYG45372.1 polar amino acid transport system substrate-binding protein [Bradyrhizobium sp. IAR9]